MPKVSPRQLARIILEVDRYPIDRQTVVNFTRKIQAAIRDKELAADLKRAGKSWRYQIPLPEGLRWAETINA